MKAKDCKKGVFIVYNNQPHKVIDYEYHAPGKGMPVVQLKLRNLITGLSTEVRFNSMADVEEADVFQAPAEFLYEEKNELYFFCGSFFRNHYAAGQKFRSGKIFFNAWLESYAFKF
jgi:elongation factor P